MGHHSSLPDIRLPGSTPGSRRPGEGRRGLARWAIRAACILALLQLLAGPVQGAAGSGRGWDPSRTFVFAVGVLQFQSSGDFEPFIGKGRCDRALVRFFRQQGVPDSHVVYLHDQDATLTSIRERLHQLLSRTRAGDLLVFYYCGHGFKSEGQFYMANYDCGENRSTWWPFGEVLGDVEQGFGGTRAFLFVDCCYSGSVVSEIGRRKRRVQYSAFSSSSSRQTSTENWTFTQSVLDALQGCPRLDLDGDGSIRGSELARYAQEEMRVFEEQRAASLFTDSSEESTVLAPRTGPLPRGREGERVRVQSEGKWWPARIVAVEPERAKVHWIQLGYHRPQDEEWVPLSTVQPIEPGM